MKKGATTKFNVFILKCTLLLLLLLLLLVPHSRFHSFCLSYISPRYTNYIRPGPFECARTHTYEYTNVVVVAVAARHVGLMYSDGNDTSCIRFCCCPSNAMLCYVMLYDSELIKKQQQQQKQQQLPRKCALHELCN